MIHLVALGPSANSIEEDCCKTDISVSPLLPTLDSPGNGVDLGFQRLNECFELNFDLSESHRLT